MNRRHFVIGALMVALSLATALALHAFVSERYVCGGGDDTTLGLFCLGHRRPAWVDPVALAILTAGIGLAAVVVLHGRRFVVHPRRSK